MINDAFTITANLALAAAVLLHLVSYFAPYGFFSSNPNAYTDMDLGGKMGLCLLPNVGLYWAISGTKIATYHCS